MKTILPFKRFFLLLLTFLVAWSCEKEEDNEASANNNESTIVSVAQETEALSNLVSALTAADNLENTDLVSTLNSEGTFTVFAPTNAAFEVLLEQLDGFETLADFDTEEELQTLKTILSYHVVAGVAAKSTDLSDGQMVTTLQGEELTISLDGGVFIQDATETAAQVTMADVETSNGVVHVIDKVLLPQVIIDALNAETMTNENGTLVEVVVATESLSLLEAAVIKADLVETLSSEGPFTVFAPSNDAFVALLEILGDDYNSLDDFDTAEEIALLKNILLFHVLPLQVKSTDLTASEVETAFQGNSIAVRKENDSFVIGDATETNANITGVDIMASNGVAHTIDKVLLPAAAVEFVAELQLKTIVNTAVETNDLSLLVDALVLAEANLVETLNTEGPFTVFAPTNAAFVDLLTILGDDFNSLADFNTDDKKALLIKVLKYHVIAGTEALSTDLQNGQMIETFLGESVGISVADGMVQILDATETNATVTTADVLASNGVVHIIDKVLLPQTALDDLAAMQLKPIVEIAVATDNLSLLVDALGQANAGLINTLSAEGPFTVFAPTNSAFVALLEYLGDDYNSLSDFDTDEEKALLVTILTYHVVNGTAAFSTALSDGQIVATFQNENLTVAIENGNISLADATDTKATVVTADIEASNGVVHIIDKVLLPQAALDALNPPVPNIVQTAQSVADLSILVSALIQADAGLVEALSGNGPFTVFAPTNEAFTNLLNDLGDNFNSIADFDTPEEKVLLAKLLSYHVTDSAAFTAAEFTDHQEIVSLQTESLFVLTSHGLQVQDKTHINANIITEDVMTSNGIVHVIDKVLLPQEIIDALH